MLFDQCQDRCRYLVVIDRNDFIHILTAILEGMLARFLHGNAVGYGTDEPHTLNFVMFDRVQHTWGTTGLYTVYFYVRIQMLDRKSHPGDQSATTDRYDHSIQFR